MDSNIFKSFSPEIFLSLSILFQLIFNAKLINNLSYNFPIIDKEVFGQTFFILFCLIVLFFNLKIEGFIFNFLLLNDEGIRIVKLFLSLNCLLILIVILRGFSLQKLNFFEFFTIFLLSTLALLLLVSSYNFLSSYLLIEMQALCFYILASFKRNSAFSTEAGLKYFIAGSFISGILLFGCSFIYGGLGTLNFNEIHLLLTIPMSENYAFLNSFLLIGFLFIIITFLFKISAVPFHFWAPDVYEGSPLSSTVIFSILPKIVIFCFFVRWLSIISDFLYEVKFLLIFVGILSVFVGSFFALKQKRVKRLLIYSSIAQIGFPVAALSTQSVDGMVSIFFFFIIYIVTSTLIWSHITLFYNFQNKTYSFYNSAPSPLFLSNLSNLFKTNKLWALSFIIIIFSIAGIPPLSGFFAKIFVIFGLMQSNEILGSLFLILIAAISVFYYLRLLKIIFFESKEVSSTNLQVQTIFHSYFFDLDCLVLVLCLFFLIFFFFYPTFLLLICQYFVLNFFSF